MSSSPAKAPPARQQTGNGVSSRSSVSQRRRVEKLKQGYGEEEDGSNTPTGLNTPYSTSMGSISSYSSSGDYAQSEGEGSEPALDPADSVDGSPGKRDSAYNKSSKRQLTQEERELFLRLEKEWREEDSWAEQPGSWYSMLAWMPVLIALRVFNVFLSILFWPVSFVARVFFGKEIHSVSFWDVPLARRKQTAVVLLFVMLLPMIMVVYSWTLILLIFPLTTLPTLSYLIWIMYIDKSHETGKRKPFMRYWKMWRHFANYFPLRLIRTTPLDPRRKYVFCYHPHGIISLGAFGNFATDSTGFSRKFPGIDLRLLTLQINFYCPIIRELLLYMGLCSAAKKSCNQILQRGPGSAIMLVVGGAAESLDSQPGTYRLTLGRKGFVRVALDNGADLVPVLGFGENDVFDTVYLPPNSWARNVQEFVRKKLGFATPIFSGRGIFQYNMGLMPHRKPIIVVVGKPIKIPKIPDELKGRALSTTAEGVALVDKYHEKYVRALRELWNLYKERWAVHRQGSLLIQK
mmetsp:Transcript_15302/g.29664  ORF Transcript_15302/g.29664 Transcript_15302/m.29664 type:complete len:518 (+) Transcript_15302:518-2071(+)|eukprot:CAMPEP_0171498082 /NCGR_PEP_ID=MMETSP0958-20121227/7643_1 /TAXON_ID=87120 /ORGANISM="Aurantiochytrium limacinum, Strain ATCCMYA-1381" /LENGTH=517 /DNA_ID=CAMNT_0012032423 /DNA_START=443 /DNA_END=1996 /DNA_ORIENTATION=+